MCHLWIHNSPRALSGFVLFWAFEIPWLSMTFSMTSPSFPWPKFDHFLGNHLSFWVCFYYFLCKKPQFILTFLINIIFHDFPWPTPKFHDFPGLENEMLKFHDFLGRFPWPVRTLTSYSYLLPSVLGHNVRFTQHEVALHLEVLRATRLTTFQKGALRRCDKNCLKHVTLHKSWKTCCSNHCEK